MFNECVNVFIVLYIVFTLCSSVIACFLIQPSGCNIMNKVELSEITMLSRNLEIVKRSGKGHIRHWISRKPLEIEAWLKTTNRKMAYGESNGQVTDDVTW